MNMGTYLDTYTKQSKFRNYETETNVETRKYKNR